MLTSEHSIVEYRNGRAFPDRLLRRDHQQYLQHAEHMLMTYRRGAGKTRRQLHRQIEIILMKEPNCPRRRIESFCKLLDEKGIFEKNPQSRSARLRMQIFSAAADFHPLVKQPDQLFEHQEHQVKNNIARKLGRPWDEIESRLYADVISFQRLQKFPGFPDAEALLSRYNVAQLQACLYRAEKMTVKAKGDFKTILRYAKLSGLLHQIERTGPLRYVMEFTGPASVLRQTRRYGVSFARFLPALLACKGWQMSAVVQTPWKTKAELILSDQDQFTSHLPPPEEFDSKLEDNFAQRFGPARDRWQLIREGVICHEGQKVFVPDFVFRHQDGAEVLLEIVGFWTPEYLAYKKQSLQQFRRRNILIAVPQRSLRTAAIIKDNVLVYKTSLKIKDVLEALEKFRAPEG